MEKSDLLKRDDKVTVTIFAPDGALLYQSTDTGYHTLDDAIKASTEKASLRTDPEDCSFEVTNERTGVSHRYRLNAHGKLKLIV